MKKGKFTGRVVQRELAMITNLMTEENFAHLPPNQQFNVTAARVWYEVTHRKRRLSPFSDYVFLQ